MSKTSKLRTRLVLYLKYMRKFEFNRILNQCVYIFKQLNLQKKKTIETLFSGQGVEFSSVKDENYK